MNTRGSGRSESGTVKVVVAARAGPHATIVSNKTTGKEMRMARCYALDCTANAILPVPDRLDCIARFALPLRAPAPESLLGMHLPHPRAGPARHERQADGVLPSTDSERH